jgi:ribosomal protein S27AE
LSENYNTAIFEASSDDIQLKLNVPYCRRCGALVIMREVHNRYHLERDQ